MVEVLFNIQDETVTDMPDHAAIHLGSRLRAARERMSLSRSDLSNIASISAGNIAAHEAGTRRPSLSTVLRLAGALDCNIADLVCCIEDVDEEHCKLCAHPGRNRHHINED